MQYKYVEKNNNYNQKMALSIIFFVILMIVSIFEKLNIYDRSLAIITGVLCLIIILVCLLTLSKVVVKIDENKMCLIELKALQYKKIVLEKDDMFDIGVVSFEEDTDLKYKLGFIDKYKDNILIISTNKIPINMQRTLLPSQNIIFKIYFYLNKPQEIFEKIAKWRTNTNEK